MGEREQTSQANKSQFLTSYGSFELKNIFATRAVQFLELQFFNIKISQRSANNQATPYGKNICAVGVGCCFLGNVNVF